jgi:hypothetical protein
MFTPWPHVFFWLDLEHTARTVHVSDTLVTGGDGDGVRVSRPLPWVHDDIRLANLTVTGNVGVAVDVPDRSSIGGDVTWLVNSILFGNGGAGDWWARSAWANFVENPLFVDPARDDYRLRSGSRAIDAGDSSVVEWPRDLYGQPRVQGRAVDIGAAEGTTASDETLGCAVVLAPFRPAEDAPICSCVLDPGLLSLGCRLLDLPDLDLAFRIPVDWKPGGPSLSTWTIDARPGTKGPFEMSLAALVNGQWTPQEWLAPEKPVLVPGEPITSAVALELPAGEAAVLRPRLTYTRDGKERAEAIELEVRLPKP